MQKLQIPGLSLGSKKSKVAPKDNADEATTKVAVVDPPATEEVEGENPPSPEDTPVPTDVNESTENTDADSTEEPEEPAEQPEAPEKENTAEKVDGTRELNGEELNTLLSEDNTEIDSTEEEEEESSEDAEQPAPEKAKAPKTAEKKIKGSSGTVANSLKGAAAAIKNMLSSPAKEAPVNNQVQLGEVAIVAGRNSRGEMKYRIAHPNANIWDVLTVLVDNVVDGIDEDLLKDGDVVRILRTNTRVQGQLRRSYTLVSNTGINVSTDVVFDNKDVNTYPGMASGYLQLRMGNVALSTPEVLTTDENTADYTEDEKNEVLIDRVLTDMNLKIVGQTHVGYPVVLTTDDTNA